MRFHVLIHQSNEIATILLFSNRMDECICIMPHSYRFCGLYKVALCQEEVVRRTDLSNAEREQSTHKFYETGRQTNFLLEDVKKKYVSASKVTSVGTQNEWN